VSEDFHRYALELDAMIYAQHERRERELERASQARVVDLARAAAAKQTAAELERARREAP
jgi:hypothetical protein